MLRRLGPIALLLTACGGPEPTITAKATLKDVNGADFGKLTFTQVGAEPVQIKISIAAAPGMAPAGEHGMHIHAGKSCVAPTFDSAQGHWNPLMMNHGHPTVAAHHGGDLGNIMIGADGTGTAELSSAEMTLLPGDATKYIAGLAVIFHANKDDGVTQMPPGNSGARVACGVIGP